MSMLERAVADLADALDMLETRLTETLADREEIIAAQPAAARHLNTASQCTERAADELSKVITDLRILVGEPGKQTSGNNGRS